MSKHKNWSAGLKPALLIAFLCLAVSLFSSTVAVGSHALNTTAENLVVGGSDCSDFMDGFAVGMAVGVLFGCVWCGAGAVIAKGIGLFC
jgi:hypothetical protein